MRCLKCFGKLTMSKDADLQTAEIFTSIALVTDQFIRVA